MSVKATEPTTTDVLETISEFLVGGGIVTMAVFPLAIPVVALLVVAALPLLAVGLVIAVLGAVTVAPVVLVRRLSRGLTTMRRARRQRRRREDRQIRGNRPMMGARG
jgi:membrane protein implicated in regulation of membrane protease activity